MNLETFERSTAIDVPRNPRPAAWNLYFRALYRRLLSQSATERPFRVVGVTSCQRGAGVSRFCCST